jgi:hypothetical protein
MARIVRRRQRRRLPSHSDLKRRVPHRMMMMSSSSINPISLIIIVGLIVAFVRKLGKVRRHHSKTLKALFPEPDSVEYRIRPLSCHDFMKSCSTASTTTSSRSSTATTINNNNNNNNNAKLLRDRIKDPNRGEVVLVRNVTDNFLIAIHKRAADNHMKGYTILQTGTFYQTKTTDLVKQILMMRQLSLLERNKNNNSTLTNNKHDHDTQQDDARRFIEVGASFGWFSLLAHKLGVQHVDIFEPNLVNVLRICQSIDANNWWNNKNDTTSDISTTSTTASTINIYPYGITAEDGPVLFQYNEDGTARINDNWGHKSQAFALDSFARERGWLERNDQVVAILKIDVGTHAPLVIAGASELISSGMVKSLIFDLTIRHLGDREMCIRAIQQLMSSGFELILWGADPRGPSNPCMWPHDDDLPFKIVQAMQRTKHHYEMSFYWTYNES